MGTRQTLQVMARLTNNAIAQSQFREAALQIIGTVSAANQAQAINGIREFVRSHIRLVADPGELLIVPEVMLFLIYTRGWTAGDCDDASMLTASLLGSVGFQVRFRAVGPREDGSYTHVFCEVLRPAYPPEWVPVDPTVTYIHKSWFAKGLEANRKRTASRSCQSIIQTVN
jgi:transglutaminase-like putative cysteine protease